MISMFSAFSDIFAERPGEIEKTETVQFFLSRMRTINYMQ